MSIMFFWPDFSIIIIAIFPLMLNMMIEEPWCASFDKAANPATMPLITTPTSCNYMSVHFFLQFCIFNESGEVKAWWATVFENFSQGFYLLLKKKYKYLVKVKALIRKKNIDHISLTKTKFLFIYLFFFIQDRNIVFPKFFLFMICSDDVSVKCHLI